MKKIKIALVTLLMLLFIAPAMSTEEETPVYDPVTGTYSVPIKMYCSACKKYIVPGHTCPARKPFEDEIPILEHTGE